MVSIFGTPTDVVSFLQGHSPLISTVIYLALLLTVLATWYVKDKTLSIHSIYTSRREMFYWLTVLSTSFFRSPIYRTISNTNAMPSNKRVFGRKSY